ncbi:MAG: glycosyltransferase family 4 protein [Anaerolineae bacterium]|jgi:glycosyltransferase involved in cell wall biosynthesis
MRIGLVTGEYPPDQGGVGDFTRELGLALTDLDHEVHVLTHVSQEAVPSTMVRVPVHRRIRGWGWGCWGEVLSLAEDLDLEVLNLQYQAAAYGMHPAIHFVPQRRPRPPVVVTFHDLRVPYLFPKAGPLRRWIVRTLARRADRVIVTNREDYLQLQPVDLPHRLRLIPIGSNIPMVPPPSYDRAAERARWDVGPDDFLLGYFGFLNESKGAEELMEALGYLVERGVPAHLLMVGGQVGSSDPTNRAYAQKVKRLVASLGLAERVHWTGYARPNQVSAGLLATDACVLPYRDGVSFRRGTLHACLTHGRAVVTTRPAVPLEEVSDGENMLLVPPRDPVALADAVVRLQSNPALRSRLEAGATALAREFTWERIARQTAALFGRLTSEASG